MIILMETSPLTPTQKREWALSVARRMVANKRRIQAETLAYYQEHPEELAGIKTELRRLKYDQLVENQ